MQFNTKALKAAMKDNGGMLYWVFDEKLGKVLIGTRHFVVVMDREQVAYNPDLKKALASLDLFQEGTVIRDKEIITDSSRFPNLTGVAQPVIDYATYGTPAQKTPLMYEISPKITGRILKSDSEYIIINEVFAQLIGDSPVRIGGKMSPVVTELGLFLPYRLPNGLDDVLAPLKGVK